MIMQIRGTHRYAYRAGEWAIIVGVEIMEISTPEHKVTRPCYLVVFPDGATDAWPIYDPSDGYEFRNVEAGTV